jgi:hypothetical protein
VARVRRILNPPPHHSCLHQALLFLSARSGFVNPGYTFARPKSRGREEGLGGGVSRQAGAGAASAREGIRHLASKARGGVGDGSGGGEDGGERIGLSGGPAPRDASSAPATAAGTHGSCRDAVAAHAPDDMWLYQEASRLFSERFRLFLDARPGLAAQSAAASSELLQALAIEQARASPLAPAEPLGEQALSPASQSCRVGVRGGARSLARCNDGALRYKVLLSLSKQARRAARRGERRAGSVEL